MRLERFQHKFCLVDRQRRLFEGLEVEYAPPEVLLVHDALNFRPLVALFLRVAEDATGCSANGDAQRGGRVHLAHLLEGAAAELRDARAAVGHDQVIVVLLDHSLLLLLLHGGIRVVRCALLGRGAEGFRERRKVSLVGNAELDFPEGQQQVLILGAQRSGEGAAHCRRRKLRQQQRRRLGTVRVRVIVVVDRRQFVGLPDQLCEERVVASDRRDPQLDPSRQESAMSIQGSTHDR